MISITISTPEAPRPKYYVLDGLVTQNGGAEPPPAQRVVAKSSQLQNNRDWGG
jgi:hypothetical protein